MTLEHALHYGKKVLQKASIAEYALDAWYLLEFITQINRANYFGNPELELAEVEWECYQDLINQRSMRVPLQHITGVQEFMGYMFQVNEHVLIPRQDTETLVETVLEQIEDGMNVLDMCTGSGCIIVSILQWCKTKGMEVVGTGVDKFIEAIKVAEQNVSLNECDCTIIQSDLFEHITGQYDIIVSNPPYIPTKDIQDLEDEVKEYDPMTALDGFEDGLFFYREIVTQSVHHLKEQGYLVFEIGYDQGEAVSGYMRDIGYKNVKVIQDLTGLDRVVIGQI